MGISISIHIGWTFLVDHKVTNQSLCTVAFWDIDPCPCRQPGKASVKLVQLSRVTEQRINVEDC